jgi:predicted Ser/Thr protein kinase
VTQTVAQVRRFHFSCAGLVYEVQREQYALARGSFGMVYRCTWRGQTVRELRGCEKRIFAREARVWLKAQHVNVVKFYGTSIVLQCDCCVMQRSGCHFCTNLGIAHGDLKCNQFW